MSRSFDFKVRDNMGRLVVGTLEGDNEMAVVTKLVNDGYFIISVTPRKEEEPPFAWLSKKKSRLKAKSLAIFCRQFSIMLKTGLSVVACLKILSEETSHKELKGGLEEIRKDVISGSSLTSAMGRYPNLFPKLFVYMMEVGEATGNLQVILERLAEYYEREDAIRRKIQEATMYPIMIAVVAVIVTITLVFFVLPKFILIYKDLGIQLPLPTRIVLGLQSIVANYWFVGVALLALLYFAFKKFASTERGTRWIDKQLLRIPVIGGFVEKVIVSRFSRTLSLLVNSGIPMIDSLDIVKNVVVNTVISNGVLIVKEGVIRGQGITEPLRRANIFPSMLIQMIAVGEETGTLDVVLDQVADFYDLEVDHGVRTLTLFIEPIVILLLAVVVVFIAASVLTPMLGLLDAF